MPAHDPESFDAAYDRYVRQRRNDLGVAAAIAVAFAEWKVVSITHFPPATVPSLVTLATGMLLPALAWWLMLRPTFEGLPVGRYLLGQLRFLREPRQITHFEEERSP